MIERRFKTDVCEIDASRIETYTHDVHGPTTIFKDVVIARAIVHEYDDGWAYKPGKELEGAYWTADGMWAISGGHPATPIIASRDQIHGKITNVRFSKSLKDPKTDRPMDRGILSDMEVYDNKVESELLNDMRNGKRNHVSIGFFFDYDATAGVVDDEEDKSLIGTKYDYIQRNIAINHVAFGIDLGRCPMPYCGIGADGTIEVTGDPVGPYETFGECVTAIMKKNPDYSKEQAEGTCGKIYKQTKEKDFKSTDNTNIHMNSVLEEVKATLQDALSKIVALEPEEDDLVEEEVQGNLTMETLSERARMFFSISVAEWDLLSEDEKNDYISRLPAAKPLEGETNKDEEDCTDCDDEEEEKVPDEDEEEEPEEEEPEEVVVIRPKKDTIDEVERAKKLLGIT